MASGFVRAVAGGPGGWLADAGQSRRATLPRSDEFSAVHDAPPGAEPTDRAMFVQLILSMAYRWQTGQ
jgi:hypothetical protein